MLNYTQGRQLDLLRSLGFDNPSWQDLGKLIAYLLTAVALAGAAWARWDRGQHDPWLRQLARVRRRLLDAGIDAPPQAPPRTLLQQVAASALPTELRQPLTDWLLALETLPPEEADLAFVAGIFSLLDVMLNMPIESALGLLSVPDEVADALLRREGFLGDLLTLAEACESSDDAVFDRAAGTLHLSSQQINFAHLQALAWADQLTD